MALPASGAPVEFLIADCRERTAKHGPRGIADLFSPREANPPRWNTREGTVNTVAENGDENKRGEKATLRTRLNYARPVGRATVKPSKCEFGS